MNSIKKLPSKELQMTAITETRYQAMLLDLLKDLVHHKDFKEIESYLKRGELPMAAWVAGRKAKLKPVVELPTERMPILKELDPYAPKSDKSDSGPYVLIPDLFEPDYQAYPFVESPVSPKESPRKSSSDDDGPYFLIPELFDKGE